MKTCPVCKELNGSSNTECWKCMTPLGKEDENSKICKHCGLYYGSAVQLCSVCGKRLKPINKKPIRVKAFLYFLSFLIPIIPLILIPFKIIDREEARYYFLLMLAGTAFLVLSYFMVLYIVSIF